MGSDLKLNFVAKFSLEVFVSSDSHKVSFVRLRWLAVLVRVICRQTLSVQSADSLVALLARSSDGEM